MEEARKRGFGGGILRAGHGAMFVVGKYEGEEQFAEREGLPKGRQEIGV